MSTTDVIDTETQEALTVICEIVDAQKRQGFYPIILVFANDDGSQYRCFRTDAVEDMNAMFRTLSTTDWNVEMSPPSFGGN